MLSKYMYKAIWKQQSLGATVLSIAGASSAIDETPTK